MVEHFLCRIANPAGRLTVVQKGGPENKKVDNRKSSCCLLPQQLLFLLQYHQLFYYNTYCIITKASSSFLHLLNLQRHFVSSPHRLLDALVEGGEKRLALQHIAGGMNLTHQDAATAHRKRTVAGLNHRNRLGGSIIHRNQICLLYTSPSPRDRG